MGSQLGYGKIHVLWMLNISDKEIILSGFEKIKIVLLKWTKRCIQRTYAWWRGSSSRCCHQPLFFSRKKKKRKRERKRTAAGVMCSYETCREILNPCEVLYRWLWQTTKNCITIIKFRCNHCINHCLSCSLINTASDLEHIFQRVEAFLCDISNMLL